LRDDTSSGQIRARAYEPARLRLARLGLSRPRDQGVQVADVALGEPLRQCNRRDRVVELTRGGRGSSISLTPSSTTPPHPCLQLPTQAVNSWSVRAATDLATALAVGGPRSIVTGHSYRPEG
jgi:hypothetical protein